MSGGADESARSGNSQRIMIATDDGLLSDCRATHQICTNRVCDAQQGRERRSHWSTSSMLHYVVTESQ